MQKYLEDNEYNFDSGNLNYKTVVFFIVFIYRMIFKVMYAYHFYTTRLFSF